MTQSAQACLFVALQGGFNTPFSDPLGKSQQLILCHVSPLMEQFFVQLV